MAILEVTLLGIMAGCVGTGLGGLIALILARITPVQLSTMLGFSAGIMISVVAFELMPEALEMGGLFWALLGLILGAVIMLGVDVILPHMHILGETEGVHSPFIKAGVVLGIGIGMHNLPEGLAIGVAGFQDLSVGIALAVAIALHNIPEGMGMAIPLKIGKISNGKIILSTVAVGIPMGLGALIGGLIGQISPEVIALALGFAAGAMLFITCDEMIPQAEKLAEGHSATLGIVTGVIIGIIILAAIPH